MVATVWWLSAWKCVASRDATRYVVVAAKESSCSPNIVARAQESKCQYIPACAEYQYLVILFDFPLLCYLRLRAFQAQNSPVISAHNTDYQYSSTLQHNPPWLDSRALCFHFPGVCPSSHHNAILLVPLLIFPRQFAMSWWRRLAWLTPFLHFLKSLDSLWELVRSGSPVPLLRLETTIVSINSKGHIGHQGSPLRNSPDTQCHSL